MFDPRPLCCSSLTTVVGGTTDTNFVDSAHPTVARIIGIVAYRLALPLNMSGVYEVFHVSMLRKYTPDPAHVVDWGTD